eukprot:56357-Chlamydomonas_euryale.AAC.1
MLRRLRRRRLRRPAAHFVPAERSCRRSRPQTPPTAHLTAPEVDALLTALADDGCGLIVARGWPLVQGRGRIRPCCSSRRAPPDLASWPEEGCKPTSDVAVVGALAARRCAGSRAAWWACQQGVREAKVGAHKGVACVSGRQAVRMDRLAHRLHRP